METFKVKLITDEFVVEDTTNKNDVKIFMLKGEKGDPGAGAIWGTIEGDISDQTDLVNLIQTDLANYYTKSEVNSLISTIPEFSIEIVQTLPTTDISTTTIYLVPKTGTTGDVYNEYIYINSNWELIGSTEVDLTNYYTKSQTDNLLNNKQATLVSGTNIKTINNNSILGSGNLNLGGGTATDVQINGTSIVSNDVANIVTEGTYNSSTNKIATMSDIPDVSSFITKNVDDLTNYTKTSDLSSVATSGSYNDLSNTPTIPTAISDLTNDSNFIETSNTTGLVKNDGTIDTTSYSTFSGSYNDLSNKPTIPDELADLSDDSTHRLVTDTEKSTWNGKGTYSKPSEGIPASDLASAVQTSLGKADTAIQLPTGTLPVYHIDASNHKTSGTAFDFSEKPVGLYIFYGSTDQWFNVYIKPRSTATTTTSFTSSFIFAVYITSVIPSAYVEDTIHYAFHINNEGNFKKWELTDKGTYFAGTYTYAQLTTKSYVDSKVLDTYSTSETKTNKVWIDNKPIYRKVFEVSITQNNADTTISNSVISNLDTVISVSGVLKNTFGNVFPLPNVNPNGTLVNGLGIFYHGTDGIRVRVGDSSLGTGAETIAIIEYTKTTD